MKSKNILVALPIAFFLLAASCKGSNEEVNGKELAEMTAVVMPVAKEEMPTIVDFTSGNDNFSTLEEAVKAANLVTILSGNGPFTVFAPTNDAFAKLEKGTVVNLVREQNKKLTSVLNYHVVSGEFNARAVVDSIKANNGEFEVNTIGGGRLIALLKDENVILKDENGNSSKVVMADVKASNGVIHVIDTVVMPK